MLLSGQNQAVERRERVGLAKARPANVASAAATELGFLAREALQDGRTGHVVAAFERSFYAILDGQWVCVGTTEIGSGPSQVLCKLPTRLRPGDAVAVVGSTLWIDDAPFVRLDNAAVWTPEVVPGWTLARLRAGLSIVDDIWRDGLIAEGLAAAGCAETPLQPSEFLQAAKPGLVALTRLVEGGLQRSSSVDSSEIVSLIGLGPGLTPSGDDLIGGALIALAALGHTDVRNALWEKCCGSLDRTNEISQAHMRTAALGYGAAALHTALHATMSGRVLQIPAALAAVAAVGHTSGRDAFAGALMVLRCAARYSQREDS